MKCKHCGNDNYFYTKASYRGTGVIYYDNSGEYVEDGLNGDMYDGLDQTEGKYFYCEQCNKRGESVANEMDEILNQFW